MSILKKVLDILKEENVYIKSKEKENEEIISAYNQIKKSVPDYNEPNYALAEKIFREYNDFNLRNINEIKNSYISSNIPKSLLPYPKNYIKCAYYIFLDNAKKQKDLKMFNLIKDIGATLFFGYPDYYNYKKELDRIKKMMKKFNENNNNISIEEKKSIESLNKKFKDGEEDFKRLFGVYEISETDYHSSPNSVDSTNEELIHDFGFLPEIEEDVDLDKIKKDTE